MRKSTTTLVIIGIIFTLSFCVMFKSISAIVQKSNEQTFEEVSLHDKNAIKNILNIWWKIASKIGEEVASSGAASLDDVRAELEKIRSLLGYEDCLLVSDSGRVYAARGAVNDTIIAKLCRERAEQFIYRYGEGEPYLLVGRRIAPFIAGGVMFSYAVDVQKVNALNNLLEIGFFSGAGFSTLIDMDGFYIISDFYSLDAKNNFFLDYENNRKKDEISREALQAKIAESAEYEFAATGAGEKSLVMISTLEGTDWKLVSQMPLSIFARQRNQIIAIYIALGAVCLATLGTFMAMYVRKNEILRKEELKHRAELLDALSLAEQASKAKTLFLGNMSQNIRTPMNAILGFTALAKTHIASGENVENYLDKISKSAHQLLALISNVLDMSRIESGKMNLNEEKESLGDIVHELIADVRSEVGAKDLTLCTDALNIAHEEIYCDRIRLKQVLANLLSNAIKFTKSNGEIYMLVSETAFSEKGYATYEFRIKDNGIGMSEEFQKSVFEPFTREAGSQAAAAQGAGLGMAITKSIVNMMGGDISVQSSPEKGAEFTVTLSFKAAKSTEKSPLTPLAVLAEKSAIVVDSDTELCNYICTMLRDLGVAQATLCATGEDAVICSQTEAQNGERLPIYILDWKTKDLQWLETVRKVKRIAGSDALIAVLTAFDYRDIEEKARESGVGAFIEKPLFPSDLRERLLSLFSEPKPNKRAISDVLHGKRALIAEDNESSREISKLILNEAGIDTVCVEDGERAVAEIEKRGAGYFDFVLMDIMMPVMDGLEATRKIRALADKELANIPIIAMTAKSGDDDKREAQESGMNAHVAKPVDVAHLFEVVKDVLSL